jgi:hypothetical protein
LRLVVREEVGGAFESGGQGDEFVSICLGDLDAEV